MNQITVKNFRFMFLNLSINFLVVAAMLIFHPVPACADQEEAKKTTTQQVGGLLFDVDEGVKLEQGPGGSVYMKSNKEYMQEKIKEIESRLTQLETKAEDFESRITKLEIKNDPAAAEKIKTQMQASEPDENPRVLVT